jgi:hypothetical protein
MFQSPNRSSYLSHFFEKFSIAMEYARASRWRREHPSEAMDKQRPTVGEMVLLKKPNWGGPYGLFLAEGNNVADPTLLVGCSLQEKFKMKKISYVLAALATIAIAAPAVAEDKPMMGDGMKKPMMHHHMKHHMMHKKMMMKKDGMWDGWPLDRGHFSIYPAKNLMRFDGYDVELWQ